MGLFNDALSKGKKFAGTVGKGASAAADTAKLNINKGETKSELKKAYEALGLMVYESKLSEEDVSAQIEESVSEITALKEKLEEIEVELLRIANKITCSSCGEINPLTASFCSKCGAKIEADVETADAEAMEEESEEQ